MIPIPDHAYRAELRKSLNTLITDFDTAIRLKPDHANAYLNRGVAKVLLNRISEAKRDLRTALRLAKQAGDTSVITRAEKAA